MQIEIETTYSFLISLQDFGKLHIQTHKKRLKATLTWA
jgi:hypothetical protein